MSQAELPYAHGGPAGSGRIRSTPQEFLVEEVLGFAPEGIGEHLFLWVEKRGENTEWVARQLARHAGLPVRSVSFAGLKDRHAVTRQWFSLHLPGRPDPNWADFNSDTVQVLRGVRHRRKLPRGALAENRFIIVVRLDNVDEDVLQQRLQAVKVQGVPNYFGEQRFGAWDDNVELARRWFAGLDPRPDRHLAGIYLSAARAFLFNAILAERVADGSWCKILPGEACMFSHGHSFFAAPEVTAELQERATRGEIHPSAPLWGAGPSPATSAVLALEQSVAERYGDLCRGLVEHGAELGRRALRLIPEHLEWRREDDRLVLSFTLPAGAYATTLLREVVRV